MNLSSRCAPLVILMAVLTGGCETAPLSAPPPGPAATTEAQPQPPVAVPTEPALQPAPETQSAPLETKEPEAVPPPKVVCEPPPPAKPQPVAPQRPPSVLPILGAYETVAIDPPGLRMKARLDTGTSNSAIDARDAREFERDGKPWVKFVVVDRDSGKKTEVSRPLLRTVPSQNGTRSFVVTLRTRLGGIDQFTEYLLADRSGSAYPIVLGHSFLRDQALVDVARRYTVQTTNP